MKTPWHAVKIDFCSGLSGLEGAVALQVKAKRSSPQLAGESLCKNPLIFKTFQNGDCVGMGALRLREHQKVVVCCLDASIRMVLALLCLQRQGSHPGRAKGGNKRLSSINYNGPSYSHKLYYDYNVWSSY